LPVEALDGAEGEAGALLVEEELYNTMDK
jgi:hypothetical protein